jgi:acyl-CoA dehydrogenase
VDFLFTDDQKKLKQKVIRLCEERLGPLEAKVGETNVLCREIAIEMAQAGLFQLFVPKKFGNTSEVPSLVSVCLVREQLARYAPNAELIFSVQGLGSYPLTIAGTKSQQEKYCPSLASGTKICAFALTEANAGSNVAAIETSAVGSGGHFVITGEKMFISLAPDADVYFVVVKTDKDKGSKGISALIVEKGEQGFDPGRRLDIVAAHVIGAPRFNNCKVPEDRLIGELNGGFRVVLQTLDFFRSSVGAGAVGLAQAALDEATSYAKNRIQFGKPIADFQAIQMKLASMATELNAARALVYRAAYLKDHGQERITMESSMAKLYATEAAQRIIDQAVQIHGGYGVLKGTKVERLYRQIRPMRVYEGTSEIQHLIIADMLLKKVGSQTN